MEIDYKVLLLWLADCEAGTAEYLKRLKSSSKSELKRHLNICDCLVKAIEQENYYGIRARKLEDVLARLKDLETC